MKSSSIKPLNESKQYVPLRCNNDSTLSLFHDPNNEAIDIYKASCSKSKQYPVLKKHENESTLCSEIGADGRDTNLTNIDIHYVQLGWNMSAMNPELNEIKNMVSFRTSAY